MYPFERFTDGARQALAWAQEEAVAANQPYIGTEHVALALARDDGAAGRVLRDLGITHEGIEARIAGVLADSEELPQRVIPTSGMKRVVEVAFQEATSAGVDRVGTEHLLAALLVEAEGVAARVLDGLGVTLPRVRRAIRAGLEDHEARRIGDEPLPGAQVGMSSSLAAALMRAGQLAREEGITDIRADHLLRAIAVTDAADLRGTLDRLGLAPEAVVQALTVPEEIRHLGMAAQRARVEHATGSAAGGEAATRAIGEILGLGRQYSEAVSRWLGEGGGP